MAECRTCNLCDARGREQDSREVKRVPSNVRRFRSERFTMWRCPHCDSLHSRDEVDLARYYEDYPLHRQNDDFFTRRQFLSRLRQLRAGGISKSHSILDYGCGNGGFVRYLRAQGYQQTTGYDPYCDAFSDRGVLAHRYDFVICQDVVEHATDTQRTLEEVLKLVRPGGGLVAIGTPDAAELHLDDPVDVVGQLHQPYHRHILSSRQLKRMVTKRGFTAAGTHERWYVDTWVPFLNSTFFFRYVQAAGGVVDAAFEPIRYALVLLSPRLLLYGFFGRLWAPKKDVLLFARST